VDESAVGLAQVRHVSIVVPDVALATPVDVPGVVLALTGVQPNPAAFARDGDGAELVDVARLVADGVPLEVDRLGETALAP